MQENFPLTRNAYRLLFVAAHLSACGVAFWLHMQHYPLGHSLYYWWFAPLDLAAILLVTPLYLFASRARLGYCVNGLISGLEALALVYFGLAQLELPFASFGTASAAWVGVALIFVRLIVGRTIVAHSPALPSPARGCVS